MLVMDMEEVEAFIKTQGPDTKYYLGSDSCRFRKNGLWYAEYTLCLVVHINGRNGCRVFGKSFVERDYDQKKSRPAMRLMNEVTKLAEFFHSLEPLLFDKYVELHIDINKKKEHGSSCIVEEAMGFLRGSCDVSLVACKPYSPAASFCADRLTEILGPQTASV